MVFTQHPTRKNRHGTTGKGHELVKTARLSGRTLCAHLIHKAFQGISGLVLCRHHAYVCQGTGASRRNFSMVRIFGGLALALCENCERCQCQKHLPDWMRCIFQLFLHSEQNNSEQRDSKQTKKTTTGQLAKTKLLTMSLQNKLGKQTKRKENMSTDLAVAVACTKQSICWSKPESAEALSAAFQA